MTLKGRRGFEAIQKAVCILNIFFLSLEPWIWKIPWRRAWQPTPVLSSTECHGQRSLVGYSPCGLKELDTIKRLTLSLSLTHTHIRLLTENNTDRVQDEVVFQGLTSFATIPALTPTKPLTHKYSVSPSLPCNSPWCKQSKLFTSRLKASFSLTGTTVIKI